jgi:hypothetical protein
MVIVTFKEILLSEGRRLNVVQTHLNQTEVFIHNVVFLKTIEENLQILRKEELLGKQTIIGYSLIKEGLYSKIPLKEGLLSAEIHRQEAHGVEPLNAEIRLLEEYNKTAQRNEGHIKIQGQGHNNREKHSNAQLLGIVLTNAGVQILPKKEQSPEAENRKRKSNQFIKKKMPYNL